MDLRKASKRERLAAEQEAKLLSDLKHPNIVAYKDTFEGGDGYLYIAMGYCERGDLYTRLKEQKGSPLEERHVVEWFVQIAMALQVGNNNNNNNNYDNLYGAVTRPYRYKGALQATTLGRP